MTSVVVFLGPTLELNVASNKLASATFLPPARCGDVYRAVAERKPAAIAIIDGLFDSVPSVWHKEILFALSMGVRVLGASSMGALRAAELWPFGMEGIGQIFERYRSGEWEDDDEVAVVHAPAEAGYRATSVAMANIRLALGEAESAGVITPSTARVLVEAAKGQYYADRSWDSVYDLGGQHGVSPKQIGALRRYVESARPDAKRDDALLLLDAMRQMVDDGIAPHRPDFDFEPTAYWEQLVATIAPVGSNDEQRSIQHQVLRRHVRVQPSGAEWLRGAALLHLLAAYRRTSGVEPTAAEVQRAVDRFRRRHGLLSAVKTRTWLEQQQITDDDLLALATLELTLEELLRNADAPIHALLPLELKRRSVFGSVTEAVAMKQRLLAEEGVTSLTLSDVGIEFGELLDWYQSRNGSIDRDLDTFAAEMGFDSVRELISELLLAYRAEREPEMTATDQT
jgi:hypothetical protein